MKLESHAVIGMALIFALGAILVTNPVWVFVLEPIGLAGGYQWFAAMGWVYLCIGSIAGGLLATGRHEQFVWVAFGASLMAFPPFLFALLTGFFQPSPPTDFQDALQIAFLMLPVALAFPAGVAHCADHQRGLVSTTVIWLTSWTAYYVLVPSGANTLPVVFVFGMLNTMAVVVFALPVYVLGRVAAPELQPQGR